MWLEREKLCRGFRGGCHTPILEVPSCHPGVVLAVSFQEVNIRKALLLSSILGEFHMGFRRMKGKLSLDSLAQSQSRGFDLRGIRRLRKS
ncbi:hypothetical protein Vadar_016371 [Vaccinium darrowii]|uniref:Uncharacterized protein n=1 Tax=Vaccinium darrowii TaxID=229202 RepID=A0ACB7YM83_9ERIC|nr:hypothetical protein Vadar_016371 [Vaccinium darrowii]